MDDLAGQAAVVTGSANGIGHAVSAELAARGARVVGLDRIAHQSTPAGVTPLLGDLASDDPEDLAPQVRTVHGHPTLVVNNVGIDPPGGFLNGQVSTLDLTLATNLRGPWLFTRALLKPLVEEGGKASVVFVGSLHSHWPRRHPHYSASKAAVAMLVREMARELGPRGVRVNSVSPGIIETASVPGPANDAERERLHSLVPLGRIGRAEDVARVVAMLLSNAACGYVTGADIAVDGGLGTFTWSDLR